MINLIGQRFGKLIVLERALSKNGRGYWLCQCDCGNKKEIRTDALKEGKTKSCGCLHKKIISKNSKKDLLGQTFGKLTVISETKEREPNTRSVIWKCKCNCGQITFVSSRNLISGHTQSCGCLKSQGEFIIGSILNANNIFYKKEKTFSTCVFEDTKRKAKFDFFVEDKYIIEFDGAQHFHGDGSGWFNEENHLKVVAHDKFKNQWCKENNIPLIRIPYTHLNKICLEDLLLETSSFLQKD